MKTTAKAKTLPNTTLEQRLRKIDGFSVQCCWQQKGPQDTGIAWVECLLVHAPNKPGVLVLVQTFEAPPGSPDGGWEAFIPASNSNSIDDTVDAVAEACRTR